MPFFEKYLLPKCGRRVRLLETLTIASVLLFSLLTRNCNVANAVTIPVNDIGNQRRIPPVSSSPDPVKVISLTSPAAEEKRWKSVERTGGYAAEWEYQGKGLERLDSPSDQLLPRPLNDKPESNSSPSPNPSRRRSPGIWTDSNGRFYVFGGEGPTNSNLTAPTNYLSDLWSYGAKDGWRFLYRPEINGDGPVSAHPQKLLFPLMCGSDANLALLGHSGKSSDNMNSLFNEDADGVVWVTDIPKEMSQKPKRCGEDGSKKACNGSEGLLWTSYICCDACLSDENTTNFDQCPQFSQESILWCSNDGSLMAIQISPAEKIKSNRGGVGLAKGNESATKASSAPVEESQKEKSSKSQVVKRSIFFHPNIPPTNATSTLGNMKNESNSQGVGQKEMLGEDNGNIHPKPLSNPTLVNWKFDLKNLLWVKMPEITVSQELEKKLENGNCRSVSDGHFVYILCSPPKTTNLLEKSLLLFDPTTSSVLEIGTIKLNNAFSDKKLWQKGRSELHALRSDDQTVIFLAYQKLLDLWIFDHSSKKLFSLENVWKGPSLDAFEHFNSFYKLSITFPSNKKTHFFMPNPRAKLLSFQDPAPNFFQITIVPDSSVFLPPRDSPSLINTASAFNKSFQKNDLRETASNLDPSNENRESMVMTKMPIEGFVERQASSDLQPDQSTHSILEANPTKESSSLGESNKRKEKKKNEDLEKDKGKEEQEPLFDKEERRTVVGLGKSENLTKATDPMLVKVESQSPKDEKGDKTKAVLLPDTETSQSKSNPSQSTPKNRNKTNNSEPKASGEDVRGIPPISKPKGVVVGIKIPLLPTETTTPPPDSLLKTEEARANEMRSLARSRSLRVNNESKGKPRTLTTSSSSSASLLLSGESRPNFPSNSGEPRVLAVVRTSVKATKMTSENSGHPSSPLISTGERGSQELNLLSPPHSEESLSEASSSLLQLKVASGSETLHSDSLSPNLDTKTAEKKEESWNRPKTFTLDSGRESENQDEDHEEFDKPNLENNYVSSRRVKGEGLTSPPEDNENFMGDTTSRNNGHLIYGSSEVMIDSPSKDSSMESFGPGDAEASYYTSYSAFGSLVFFSLSLSIFFTAGLIVFFRRCVRCDQSDLIKEPPPIRYAVVPEELSFHHTPLV